MRNFIIKFIALVGIVCLGANSAWPQMATINEVTKVAHNWISLVVSERGCWGNYPYAEPQMIQNLYNKDEKIIGYYCQVKPAGFIVISLRKELAPVKAYSAYSNFDPSSEESVSHLIKEKMTLILDTIEKQLGPLESIIKQNLTSILEVDYSSAWDNLLSNEPAKSINKDVPSGSGKNNYQEGEIMLLGNNWHQHPPFNEDCPYLGCTTPSNGRAFVGCVATAGAQIMYHWNWPPYGSAVVPYNDAYDWPNMLDVVTTSSPQVTIDAVAELGYEVALAVNMDFGCEGSGAAMYDMEGVFEDYYRYSEDCMVTWRQNYTATTWFNMLKGQFNLNRPVEYGIIGHAIVGDGWQEIGSPVVKQYHMNWGWTGTSNDTWYTLDELPDGGLNIEHIVGNIYPSASVGTSISGTYYELIFPYRYFDRDSYGSSATFAQGNNLQFLENVEVVGTGTSTYVRFDGTLNDPTRLFTAGVLSHGIFINNGTIRLKNSGSIKLQ